MISEVVGHPLPKPTTAQGPSRLGSSGRQKYPYLCYQACADIFAQHRRIVLDSSTLNLSSSVSGYPTNARCLYRKTRLQAVQETERWLRRVKKESLGEIERGWGGEDKRAMRGSPGVRDGRQRSITAWRRDTPVPESETNWLAVMLPRTANAEAATAAPPTLGGWSVTMDRQILAADSALRASAN